MRPDMAKILVERPRGGGGVRTPKGLRKRLQKYGIEDSPRCEGMKRPWQTGGCQKWLNENLAPLVRFLRSRVGGRWDDVHSEIMEHVSFDNAVQRHILQHLWQYVERHVIIIDGKPTAKITRGWPGDGELRSDFYVDPRDGILRENPRRGRRRWSAPVTPIKPGYLAINDQTQIHRLAGIWYEVAVAPVPADTSTAYDIVHHARVCELSGSRLHQCYGGWKYAVRKRQLNKREIARLRDELAKLAPEDQRTNT